MRVNQASVFKYRNWTTSLSELAGLFNSKDKRRLSSVREGFVSFTFLKLPQGGALEVDLKVVESYSSKKTSLGKNSSAFP